MLGGYRLVRVWHFVALCGFAAFVPGHLVMVALHGWDNFAAMLTGWKREPEDLAVGAGQVATVSRARRRPTRKLRCRRPDPPVGLRFLQGSEYAALGELEGDARA